MTWKPFADATVVESAGVAVAGGLLALGVIMSSTHSGDAETTLAFAVFSATVVIWVTKPVPYEVSSVLCVVALSVLGVADSFAEAAAGFSSSLVFFLLLLLLIGKTVSKVDLDEWVANRIVTARSTPRTTFGRLSSAILLMAFIMPSGMARTVAFMPVIDEINETHGLPEDSPFRRISYFVIGHVNPIVSLALMTGGGMSVLTSELINADVRSITWIEWALYMVPPVVLLYAFTVATATRVYSLKHEPQATGADAQTSADRASPDTSEAASLTGEQRFVIAALLAAIALWIVGSFVGIPTIIPAVIVVGVFALPWVRLITVEEFRTLSWGFLFLIGAMLSLIEVMQKVNAFDVVIDGLFLAVPSDSPSIVVLALLFVFAILLRATFSSVAAAILILFPVFVEFSTILGYNSLFVTFALVLVLGSTTLLPFNFSTVLIAYERGPLSTFEVFALGVLMMTFSIIVVVLSWAVYWPFVEGATASFF